MCEMSLINRCYDEGSEIIIAIHMYIRDAKSGKDCGEPEEGGE